MSAPHELVEMKRCIGLVVPSLEEGGGVPAVAKFILDAAHRDGRYRVQPISLAMSSADSCSTRLVDPRTWMRGVTTRGGEWQGLPLRHVGAHWTDFEFQRYQPRKTLAEAVASCDILQVVAGSPAWANAVIGLGKPVALHVATRVCVERRRRDADPRTFSAWWRKGMTSITNRLDDRALRMADAVQVMNPWMLDYARHVNGARNFDLRYAPPGVDADAFRPLFKRDLKSDPYILCVARLSDPRKNIGLLLDAYAQQPQHLVNQVRLILAGSSAPPDSFWRRVEQLGVRERVTYVAQPSQLALISLYQHASVFALPSDEEGFGMVLIEAMACGVPVVSTGSGGPDGIISDGENGFLVGLDDALQMASRLGLLLRDADMNLRMGIAARTTVDTYYSEQVAGAAFLNIWDKFLSSAN